MNSRAAGDLVALRGAVVALLSLLLATAAHVSAGGLLPAPWLLAAMTLLAGLASAMWLDRRASRRQLAGLLVAGQTTIHIAMTALAGHGGEPAHATTVGDALGDTAHHVLADLGPSGLPMMLAHLSAAALTGLLLAHGEALLWNALVLLARAATFVALVLTPFVAPAALVRRRLLHPVHADAAPRRTQLLLVSSHVRRGPPALLTAR